MRSRLLSVGLLWTTGCLLLTTGCVTQESTTPLVPANPFGNAPVVQTPKRVAYSPASEEAAKRVIMVSQKVLTANPQLGFQPVVATVGAPQAELFHVGTSQVFITEGLVKKCATDGQLAAVLSMELGRMVAEREALAGPHVRSPERPPPVEMRVGTDSGGTYGSADLTRLAELGKYEQERKRPALPPPDPKAVAVTCLMKAGYNAVDLDAAQPLLQAAGANSQLEKQISPSSSANRSWTR